MQRKNERQEYVEWFIRKIMDAYDIEKVEFCMQGRIGMTIVCRLAGYPKEQIVEVLNYDSFIGADVKRRYVRMKDGTEVEFESLNECVEFIRDMETPGMLEMTNHFRDLTKTTGGNHEEIQMDDGRRKL